MGANEAAAAFMRGLNQAVDDMVKITAIKSQYEEAERKKLEWQRKEEERNRIVSWGTSRTFLSMSPEMQDEFKKFMQINGYSDDGLTSKAWQFEAGVNRMGLDQKMGEMYFNSEIQKLTQENEKLAAELDKIPSNRQDDIGARHQKMIDNSKRIAILKGKFDEWQERQERIANAKAELGYRAREANAKEMQGRAAMIAAEAARARAAKEGATDKKIEEERENQRKIAEGYLITSLTGVMSGKKGEQYGYNDIDSIKDKEKRFQEQGAMEERLKIIGAQYSHILPQTTIDRITSEITGKSSVARRNREEYISEYNKRNTPQAVPTGAQEKAAATVSRQGRYSVTPESNLPEAVLSTPGNAPSTVNLNKTNAAEDEEYL